MVLNALFIIKSGAGMGEGGKYASGQNNTNKKELPYRDELVVSMPASHAVGRKFTHWLGHTKDRHENGTNCIPAWHAGVRVRI